jgi:hypothetical protein
LVYYLSQKQSIMSDQLNEIIQQAGQQAVAENDQIPNEHSDAIVQEAQKSITGGLQNLAQSGDLAELAQNPQAAVSHPAVQGISDNFMQNIMNKFGLSKLAAGGLASTLIPMVMGKVLGGGGGGIGGLLSSLTGGGGATAGNQQASGSGGMLGNIGSALGLDKDGDGSIGLGDLSKLI